MNRKLAYGPSVVRAIARDPYEAKERILDRLDEWREHRRPGRSLDRVPEWDERLHGLVDAPWPCRELDTFAAIWKNIARRLERKGVVTGRGAFGGWDDADPALARAAWCITRHSRPRSVVETGVGRGITTSVILAALRRNGLGRLFSIDQPPLIDLDLHTEIGAAIPEQLRADWTLVSGSSRRRLRSVLAQVDGVDFFLHDSMHTARNVTFELTTVWPRLSDGGFALVDDIDRNGAFPAFAGLHSNEATAMMIPADDGRAAIGLIQKLGRAEPATLRV